MSEMILVYVPAIFAIALSLPYVLGFFVGVARAIREEHSK